MAHYPKSKFPFSAAHQAHPGVRGRSSKSGIDGAISKTTDLLVSAFPAGDLFPSQFASESQMSQVWPSSLPTLQIFLKEIVVLLRFLVFICRNFTWLIVLVMLFFFKDLWLGCCGLWIMVYIDLWFFILMISLWFFVFSFCDQWSFYSDFG